MSWFLHVLHGLWLLALILFIASAIKGNTEITLGSLALIVIIDMKIDIEKLKQQKKG